MKYYIKRSFQSSAQQSKRQVHLDRMLEKPGSSEMNQHYNKTELEARKKIAEKNKE